MNCTRLNSATTGASTDLIGSATSTGSSDGVKRTGVLVAFARLRRATRRRTGPRRRVRRSRREDTDRGQVKPVSRSAGPVHDARREADREAAERGRSRAGRCRRRRPRRRARRWGCPAVRSSASPAATARSGSPRQPPPRAREHDRQADHLVGLDTEQARGAKSATAAPCAGRRRCARAAARAGRAPRRRRPRRQSSLARRRRRPWITRFSGAREDAGSPMVPSLMSMAVRRSPGRTRSRTSSRA